MHTHVLQQLHVWKGLSGRLQYCSFLPVPHLNSEDMTAMAELPFVKADVREIFESKFHAVSE